MNYIPNNSMSDRLFVGPRAQYVWTDEHSIRARRWLNRNGFHPDDVRAMDHTEVFSKLNKHYPKASHQTGARAFFYDGAPLA